LILHKGIKQIAIALSLIASFLGKKVMNKSLIVQHIPSLDQYADSQILAADGQAH